MAAEIVQVVLGPNWSDTVLPFQILSLGVVARGSYKIDDSLARALGVMYQRSLRDAIYAAAVVLGALIGLRWGLPGVAFGVLGAVIINYVLALQMSKKLLDCSWSQIIKALIPAIYPTIVVAVVSISVRSLLQAFGLPAWLILGATVLISGLSLMVLYLLRPQILGFYGIETLKKSLPSIPVQIFPKTVSKWFLAKLDS
jgi:PST family polysaccharide transporter